MLPGRAFRYALVLLLPVLLGGCASVLSSHAMAQVSPNAPLSAVLDDPARFRDRVILVAGDILRTENRTDGTLLEILGYPLTDRGFPDTSEPALGRFALLYPGHLDPLIYEPGRQVAALGKIAGSLNVKIGEAERAEPLLNSLELRLLEPPTYYAPFRLGVGVNIGF